VILRGLDSIAQPLPSLQGEGLGVGSVSFAEKYHFAIISLVEVVAALSPLKGFAVAVWVRCLA